MNKRSLASLWGPHLGMLGLLSLMLSLISLAQPLFMLNLYDRVLSSQSAETLLSITVITLFVLACYGGFDWARTLVQGQMGRSLEEEVRPELLEVAVRLAAVGRDDQARQRVAKLDELKHFVTSGSFAALFDLVFVPVYFVALYLFHPIILLLCAALALGTVAFALASEWTLKSTLAEYWKHKYHLRFEEELLTRNAVDMVTLGRVKQVMARFLGHQGEVEEKMERTQLALGRVDIVQKVVMMIIQTVILAVTCLLVIRREVPMGVLFAVNIVATRAMQPLFKITASFRSLARAANGWAEISDSLARYRVKHERAEQPITSANLRVRALTVLDQQEDRKIIQNVHLDLDPGELLVVTGASGAGKSTMLRAVVGLIPDYVGSLQLDNRELKHWRFERPNAFIGYLPQDVRLFNTSIAENITGDAETKDMDALIALCTELGVHEDIAALKDGYESIVRADAPQFSGGQIRLLGLARALWGNPGLLVLDEPTSGLDFEREVKILQALRRRQEAGAAILVATHSVHLLRASTKVLWLKWGQSKSYGLRDDVLAKMGMREAA